MESQATLLRVCRSTEVAIRTQSILQKAFPTMRCFAFIKEKETIFSATILRGHIKISSDVHPSFCVTALWMYAGTVQTVQRFVWTQSTCCEAGTSITPIHMIVIILVADLFVANRVCLFYSTFSKLSRILYRTTLTRWFHYLLDDSDASISDTLIAWMFTVLQKENRSQIGCSVLSCVFELTCLPK